MCRCDAECARGARSQGAAAAAVRDARSMRQYRWPCPAASLRLLVLGALLHYAAAQPLPSDADKRKALATLRRDPCQTVESKSGALNSRLCRRYDAMPLIVPDCSKRRTVVPRVLHATSRSPKPPQAVLANARANPDYVLRYRTPPAAAAYLAAKCGEEAAAAYACLASAESRADLYRCDPRPPSPHPPSHSCRRIPCRPTGAGTMCC